MPWRGLTNINNPFTNRSESGTTPPHYVETTKRQCWNIYRRGPVLPSPSDFMKLTSKHIILSFFLWTEEESIRTQVQEIPSGVQVEYPFLVLSLLPFSFDLVYHQTFHPWTLHRCYSVNHYKPLQNRLLRKPLQTVTNQLLREPL